MQQLKKIISVVLSVTVFLSVITVVFPLGVSAATVKVAYINGSNINVRKSASTSATSIDKISYREVNVTSVSGDWLKIKYTTAGKEYSGYIKYNSDYIYSTSYDSALSFANQLKNFPESYHAALKELNKNYPNWVFIPDKVELTLEEAVEMQMTDMRKQVSGTSHPISWRSMGKGSYDWSTSEWQFTNGGWTGASREVIAYYMDPRNFLNDTEIYAFLKQGYAYGDYTEEGLKKVVKDTFLEKGYSDPDNKEGYKGSYIKILLEAGKQSGVNPYVLAAALIQEQGSQGTSSLISGTYKGYKGYYNFFNYNASGGDQTAVIKNGLAFAKEQGWNTRAKSIIGGAKRFIENYIEIGQDTYFYQDFNINFYNCLWHQYAQAVHDARSKGYQLNKVYKDSTKSKATFRIPVYSEMPEKASAKPVENNKKNNYYFTKMSVTGLTPSFSRNTFKYDLQVTGDMIIDVKHQSSAQYTGKGEYTLKKGTQDIVLTVKSQTGYTNSYTISVNATKACKLYVNDITGGTTSTPETAVVLGDVNGDSKITASDMANIRLHILGKYMLKDNAFTAADINKDAKITVSDMANVRLHLLGKYTIK